MGFIWDARQWFHFKVEWMSFFSFFFSSFFIPFSSSPSSLSSWCRCALWDHSCRSLMWRRTLQCRISLFAISPLKSCLLPLAFWVEIIVMQAGVWSCIHRLGRFEWWLVWQSGFHPSSRNFVFIYLLHYRWGHQVYREEFKMGSVTSSRKWFMASPWHKNPTVSFLPLGDA